MTSLANFFKESHSALGVFYPLHYVIAVFADLGAAQRAQGKLLASGFAPDDVLATEGKALIELQQSEASVVNFLMQIFSRDLGSEQISTDHNRELAEQGSALVMVRCPSELLKKQAWKVLAPEKPITAHYYDRLGVEHLAGGFDTL